MSPSAPISVANVPTIRVALRTVLLALPLWLGLLQLPAPFSIEIFDAPPMAADYAVRHGFGFGTDFPTPAGPLGALLTRVHSGQPLWLNYWCQTFTSLVFAVALSWTIWRAPNSLRWWLLGAVLAVSAFRAEYLHLTLLILGGIMLIARPLRWFETAGIGLVLGLLALIDVHFAWLSVAAVLLGRTNPVPATARLAPLLAGAVLVITMLIGWVWTGQSLGSLASWLADAVTTAGPRHEAAEISWSRTASAFGLLAIATAGALLAGTALKAETKRSAVALSGFVAILLIFVWRKATGQPGYGPQPFFAAVFVGGIAWLALGQTLAPTRWVKVAAGGAIASALSGLLAVEPRILTESVILLNQRMVANVTALFDRRGWQRAHNDAFRTAGQLFALPRIKAAVGDQRTDLLGNAVGYALVNRLNYAPRPGVQGYRVEDAAMSARDAAYYYGPDAPIFVVQRLQAFAGGLAVMEDAEAQLALYARYEFLFEENGFALWRRREAAGPPAQISEPVWQANVTWDEPVALPLRQGRAYWLKVHTRRTAFGWLKNQLLFPANPSLVLRDAEGTALSYRASLPGLATGFLLDPLFRGEIDLVRHQAGQNLAAIREITLQKPAGQTTGFADAIAISLHEVPAPAVSGSRESAESLAARFRISNRLPVAISAYFPPQTARIDQREILLAHPDCSIEFPVRSGDRSLQGGFGLLEGSYQNGNATDGVEFVAEYIPSRGPAVILWRRDLDPINRAADRGLQAFSVDFPQPASGRVILHTRNRAGHNAAWDWSLWTDLRFEPALVTK